MVAHQDAAALAKAFAGEDGYPGLGEHAKERALCGAGSDVPRGCAARKVIRQAHAAEEFEGESADRIPGADVADPQPAGHHAANPVGGLK